MKHLKTSPPTHPLVDSCIECGFCESNCPSRDVTLTPRQRITVLREMSRLKSLPSPTPEQDQRWVLLSFHSLLCYCIYVRGNTVAAL